jgi:hypothetical protein
MTATATTPTIHGWLARAISDIAVITRRNLLFTVRLPQVLVLSSIMPVIFILMFTYVFGGAIQNALPPPPAATSTGCSPACWPSSPCSAGRPPRLGSPRTSPRAPSTGSARSRWPARRCWPAGPSPTWSA